MKVWKIPCNSNFRVTYPYGVYDANLNITSDHRHHGVDIVIDDKRVISASVGKVIFAGWNNQGYGNLVMVQSGSDILYYAHLKSINVSYGQEVNYLTEIGIQGATGYVTGEHLHFEVRRNGQAINSASYMGIPNDYGYYNPNDYGFEDNPQPIPQPTLKYKIGQLVVYSTYYSNPDSNVPIDCIQNLGSWMQDYIDEILPEHRQPYRLHCNRYLTDGDIREVK